MPVADLAKRLRTVCTALLSAFVVFGNAAAAERWTETVTQAEEGPLAQVLIQAIRAEDWSEAVEIADRYRGSPTSAFSQYQAFAYAMTGRPDLVSALQRDGQIPGAAVCDEASSLELSDAVATIVEAAASHRAVIIQELHWEVQHRLILHELLPRLREQGYAYFAAEDFEGTPEYWGKAGYPGAAPGFHSTREPIFADAVRTAIKLGYQLIPYEASFPPDIQPQDFQRYRSEHQAENLYRRIFSGDPEARAIIYTGSGWAREVPNPAFPDDAPMVVHLKQLSGIDPLTIDQTTCREESGVAGSLAVIAFDADGEAALRGVPAGTFDLQVRYAPAPWHNGRDRAEWLTRLGRKPVAVPESLTQSRQSGVIEAHVANEPADATPLDRIYWSADEELPLLLPSGDFRVTFHPGDGESVSVTVE